MFGLIHGLYIYVQLHEGIQQRGEQCEDEGAPCETDGDAPQMNVGSTVCRQKYTTYKLYAINVEGEQVYDSFSLPSSCICYHKSSFSIRGQFDVDTRSGPAVPRSRPLPVCPATTAPFGNSVEQFAFEQVPATAAVVSIELKC